MHSSRFTKDKNMAICVCIYVPIAISSQSCRFKRYKRILLYGHHKQHCLLKKALDGDHRNAAKMKNNIYHRLDMHACIAK